MRTITKLIATIACGLLLIGCEAMPIGNNVQRDELHEILMLNRDLLVFVNGKDVITYDIKNATFEQIFQNTGWSTYKTQEYLDQFLIYEYPNENYGLLTTGTLNYKRDAVELITTTYTKAELIELYDPTTVTNVSQEFTAYINPFGNNVYLNILNNTTDVEGQAAYGNSFSELTWSPDGEHLAYLENSLSGESYLNIFNTNETAYLSKALRQEEDYYLFESYSQNISNMVLTSSIENKPEIRTALNYWLNAEELLFNVKTSIWNDFEEVTYWIYNTNHDNFEKIGLISTSEGWNIKSTILSKDRLKMAYIIENVQETQENAKNTPYPQELWVVNVDGSEAELIYKNY